MSDRATAGELADERALCARCATVAPPRAVPAPVQAPAGANRWKLIGALVVAALSILAMISGITSTRIAYRQMRALERISEHLTDASKEPRP